MNNTTKQETINGDPYGIRNDFTLLTSAERRKVQKTAQGFLYLQRENAAPADTPVPFAEGEI